MLKDAEKVFYQLDKLLVEAEQVDVVYRAYLKQIAQAFKVKRVSLMLVDETRRELFVHEAEGLTSALKSSARVRIGEGISGWVAKRGESVLVENIKTSRVFSKAKKDKGFKSGSFICIPIKLRGKVYGVLNVSEKKNLKAFSVDELRRLEIFGAQLAILVENDRLRREIELIKKRPVEEVAQISHDFLIPLTCVQEVLALINEGELGPVTDAQEEFVDLAKRNVKRMMKIFEGLIGLATRATAEHKQIEKVDLAGVLEDLAKDFSVKARRKRVHIELVLPRNGRLSTKAETDALKIHDVLMNIIDNAVKFTQPGTDIILRLKTLKSFIRIEVSDSGPGITDKDRRLLFDKAETMRRVRNRKGVHGHGLGLAISRDVLHSMGGKIDFRSEKDKGTTFVIDIPKKIAKKARSEGSHARKLLD